MYQFGEIIGQETVVRYLQASLRTGSFSHACILSGEPGSGKKMIAMTAAAALLCEDLQVTPDGRCEPCGQCLSCLQIRSGSHPDVQVLEREKPGSIGVGEIRRIRSEMQILPYRSAHKIAVIPDAHLMTVQAQNALLKTLEEPPAYAVLLLLTEGTETFLPTVLSRCITLKLRPVPENAVRELLIGRGVDQERAAICARFSGGSVGKALQLAQNEGSAARRDSAVQLLRRIEKADTASVIGLVSELVAADGATEFLDLLDTWYRDVLVCKTTGSADRLIFTGEIQYIKEAADTLSYGTLQRISSVRAAAGRRLKARVNTELVLELLLLQIRQACRRDRRAGT